MLLTQKQEKFVQELIKGKSQRQAYRSAYNAKNMKDNSVDREACLLFKSPKISQRYKELRTKVTKRAEAKAIITAEEVLRGIADIARDDIGNYLEYKTVKTVVDHSDDGEPVVGYSTIIDLKDSKDIDIKNISEVSLSKGTFKFKLYEKDKALYKLADLMGLDKPTQDKQRLAEDRFEHEKEQDEKKNW